MKKMIERMKECLRENRQVRREKKAKQRHGSLVRESEVVVQAREFEGEMFLCVDNEPIVPTDGLAWDLPTALAVARESWVRWRERNIERCKYGNI